MSLCDIIFILLCVDFNFVTNQMSIRGKGSSFPYEIYKTWMKEYRFYRLRYERVEMSYDPVGSSEGQATLLQHNSTTQYAGSSSALLAKKNDLVEFPSMAG
jgi:ABC-type phosphate transport system substrate-binding protein